MTKLFSKYEEHLSVIITMIRDFSDESLNRIGLAINVCHSLQDDNEKIFRLNAVYNRLCKCLICKIITVNKLRDANERKRPEIYSK